MAQALFKIVSLAKYCPLVFFIIAVVFILLTFQLFSWIAYSLNLVITSSLGGGEEIASQVQHLIFIIYTAIIILPALLAFEIYSFFFSTITGFSQAVGWRSRSFCNWVYNSLKPLNLEDSNEV